MIKREFKYNFKSFLIWLIATLAMFLLVYLVYPSLVSSENIEMLNEMMEMFPKEMLKAFNMDITSIDSAYGWLKTEGFFFILLIGGMYSSVLGSSILVKEESDKTIEYLHSLPIKRKNIVTSKMIVGVTYIVSFVFIIGLFNFISLLISSKFDILEFILLSITPLFSSLVLFFVMMFLSTFTHKSKKMIGIALALVMFSYVIQTVSSMGKEVEFLKYLSVFTLADIRNVILNGYINFIMIIITTVISLLFGYLTIKRYNRKELV